MHHPDSAGDYGSVRKVAHQTMFPTSGSDTGSGSNSLLSTAANTVVNNSPVPVDDYQPALLIQPQSPSGLSSQTHHPPHSLNLQSQPAQSAGAQMKKKSGFQITSVTSAQMSIGTNNSIAEDTESYDDLDESHTEDLSSSEILDVSLSRANDIAGAERSSSEETLNNFHDAESPGAISPNQPSHPHPMKHAAQHGGSIVNGTIHHYTHHHVTHHHSQSTAPCVTPKIFANVGAILDKVSDGSVVAHPGGGMTSASLPGMHSSVTGTTAGVVNPQSSNASNVNVPSANVFVRDAKGSSASSSSCAFPLCGISNIETGVIGNVAMGGNLIETIQQHHTMNSTIITTTMDANKAHAAAAVHSGALAGIGGQYGTDTTLSAVSYTLPQPVPTSFPVTATTSSRFRVVKLDASSEPFKKGRWTCTEYYDKDTPASAPSFSSPEVTGPAMQAGDSMQQFVPESFTGGSERESTSGSSVSSTVSTLSHYTDSVGSGEVCGVQHSQDYATPFQGFQASLFSGLNIGVSHTQSPIHPHDHTHAHLKTTVAPAALTSIHQSVSLTGIQNSMGNPISAVSQQQITYAQAVASRPSVSSQNIVMVQQQQMVYAPLPQQPPTTPLYGQAHQSLPQPTASQHLAHKPGSGPSAYGNGKDQGVGGQQQQQQPVVSMPVQTKLQPTTSLQANASSVVLQLGVAGLGHQPPSQPIPLDRQQQQPQKPLTNQGLCNSLPSAVHSSNGASLSVPPVNPKSEPQSLSQCHNGVNSVGMSVSQCQLSCVSVAQAHTTQASVLYASLPTFSTTQLEDAQRLLLQHQSALLGLPKLAEAACGPGATAALGQGAEGNASAFTSSTAFFKTVDGEEDSSSGASVVAIDNKIEQAMDLVKSHLMYAVREEVEVLKEQIKELIERNSQLEQENSLLKTLASPEQMAQFQAQVQTGSPTAQAGTPGPQSLAGSAQPVSYNSGSA